jgi:citrate lyase subunit beta/citryl-CoA lyase
VAWCALKAWALTVRLLFALQACPLIAWHVVRELQACLDGVHLDLDDVAGFEASCFQGRALGFDGKTLIHPKTLGPCNTVFAPGELEVAHARRVVAAFADAASAGSALVVLDGKLVEELHVRSARYVLALHDAIQDAT